MQLYVTDIPIIPTMSSLDLWNWLKINLLLGWLTWLPSAISQSYELSAVCLSVIWEESCVICLNFFCILEIFPIYYLDLQFEESWQIIANREKYNQTYKSPSASEFDCLGWRILEIHYTLYPKRPKVKGKHLFWFFNPVSFLVFNIYDRV